MYYQKKQGEILRSEVNSFYEEVNDVKKQFAKELGNYTKEVRQIESTLDSRIKELSEKYAVVNGHAINHKGEIQKQDQWIESTKKQIEELYEKVTLALTCKVEQKVYDGHMGRMLKEVKKCRDISDDVENSMKYIENYLEVYQPIRTQNQISEALVNVIPRSFVHRLKKYNEERYFILEDRIRNLKGEMACLKKVSYIIPQIRDIMIDKVVPA